MPSEKDARRTNQPKAAVERVGEVCEHCSWTLTIEEVQRRHQEQFGTAPSASGIRSKLASLGEGHAYFNRGHRVRRTLSPQAIERYINTEGEQ